MYHVLHLSVDVCPSMCQIRETPHNQCIRYSEIITSKLEPINSPSPIHHQTGPRMIFKRSDGYTRDPGIVIWKLKDNEKEGRDEPRHENKGRRMTTYS